MSFKDKPIKKIVADTMVTIDALHNDIIEEFTNNKKVLEESKQELKKIVEEGEGDEKVKELKKNIEKCENKKRANERQSEKQKILSAAPSEVVIPGHHGRHQASAEIM